MRKILIFLLCPFFANASDLSIYKKYWNLPDSSLIKLKNSEILVDASVQKKESEQIFDLKGMALHQKKCTIALRKLSMLEEFPKWISFIKSSEYDEKLKLWTVRADHALLPYPMIVHIIVERPTKEGEYTFIFPTGIFTGLKGEFIIKEYNNRCLFFASSHWQGKDTKIPNFVIELFSKTLATIAGNILMHKSQF